MCCGTVLLGGRRQTVSRPKFLNVSFLPPEQQRALVQSVCVLTLSLLTFVKQFVNLRSTLTLSQPSLKL